MNTPVTKAELAAALVTDQEQHTALMERRFAERTKQMNRRLAFLFGAMFLIFGLLAYRTEVNADALASQQKLTEQAFYQACLVRQDRQEQANIGRETMVQLAAAAPTAPSDPAAKATMIEQLRTALLLPVEDCGEPPSQ